MTLRARGVCRPLRRRPTYSSTSRTGSATASDGPECRGFGETRADLPARAASWRAFAEPGATSGAPSIRAGSCGWRSSGTRCSVPAAMSANAVPMILRVPARRADNAAGNNTWVRPQPTQRAHSGCCVSRSSPRPRAVRARACPWGSRAEQSGHGISPASNAAHDRHRVRSCPSVQSSYR